LVGDGRALLLGERFLQRATLVHSSGGDDTMVVRNSFESFEFAGGKFHRILQKIRSDEFR
jgi:hypothetical protein